jgi:hypothetical protein
MPDKPLKCDLCSRSFQDGDECFTYETPSTGTLEEAEAGTAYYCDDPEWALCEMCHLATKAFELGHVTDVEWAIAVFKEWQKHNHVTILPDTEENKAEAAKLNFESMEWAMQLIAAFVQFHTPGVKYTEII